MAGFFVAAALLIAIAIGATTTPAAAGHMLTVGLCFARAAVLGRGHYNYPDLALRGYHHDAEALWLVRRINATPPPTAYLADEVLVYSAPGQAGPVAFLFHGDCAVMGIDLAPGLYGQWMKFLRAAIEVRGRGV